MVGGLPAVPRGVKVPAVTIKGSIPPRRLAERRGCWSCPWPWTGSPELPGSGATRASHHPTLPSALATAGAHIPEQREAAHPLQPRHHLPLPVTPRPPPLAVLPPPPAQGSSCSPAPLPLPPPQAPHDGHDAAAASLEEGLEARHEERPRRAQRGGRPEGLFHRHVLRGAEEEGPLHVAQQGKPRGIGCHAARRRPEGRGEGRALAQPTAAARSEPRAPHRPHPTPRSVRRARASSST